MTSTTSSPPATPRPDSRRPANPLATATTSGATAPAVAVARVALVAGATGLVGQAVLARLLADKAYSTAYSTIYAVGRRAPDRQHARLVAQVTDSFHGFTAPAANDVFIALGTTIRVAGSREAFRSIDFDAVVAVARAARAAGATRLGVVSAMGADNQSPVFYNRVKGEMEDAVAGLGFETLVIARPSLLAGDRASLRQAQRPGEKWALAAAAWFRPLIPNNYRAIQAADVAAALVTAVQAGQPGRRILLSGEMQPR